MIHYHIHWSEKGLDWERFNTQREAEKAAKQLAHPDETYTVEEHDGGCPQCVRLMNLTGDSSIPLNRAEDKRRL